MRPKQHWLVCTMCGQRRGQETALESRRSISVCNLPQTAIGALQLPLFIRRRNVDPAGKLRGTEENGLLSLALHSGRDGRCGLKPLLHLLVAYQPRLLHHQAASRKDREIRYASHIETRRELWIRFCVHFEYDGLPGHLRSSAHHFRSCGMAGTTPLCPASRPS